MKPVICFYKKKLLIYSTEYELIDCPETTGSVDFLNIINKKYFNQMKILKINYDAFLKENNFPKEKLFNTSKISVFILKKYQIINENKLITFLNRKKIFNEDIKFHLHTSENDFKTNINSILDDIRQGRFYQINYTATLSAETSEKFDTLSYFAEMSKKIGCQYKSFLPLSNSDILCFSPELFLEKSNDVVKSQPIKGTLIRGHSIEDLANSTKEHSELSMIVDLLRNDLNRLQCSKYKDHTRVNFHRKIMDLKYTTHTYSEVEIKSSKILPDILNETFPGGSISGCPKIESLKKINEIEFHDRDYYTGSIGWWKQDHFKLNISIRSFLHNQKKLYYSTGCGVVFDSTPENEWNEFLTKSSFVNVIQNSNTNSLKIRDTLFCNKNGFTYLKQHILRTQNSLRHYKIEITFEELEKIYHQIEKTIVSKILPKAAYIIKIDFPIQNDLKNPHVEYDILKEQNQENIILELLHWGDSPMTSIKTNNRQYWNYLLSQKQSTADDILVYNSKHNVTETSIYSLFYLLNNQAYTPPLEDGCLNGVLRSYYLQQGYITINNTNYPLSERSLPISDLNHVELYVGNSVRGIKKAKVI